MILALTLFFSLILLARIYQQLLSILIFGDARSYFSPYLPAGILSLSFKSKVFLLLEALSNKLSPNWYADSQSRQAEDAEDCKY